MEVTKFSVDINFEVYISQRNVFNISVLLLVKFLIEINFTRQYAL